MIVVYFWEIAVEIAQSAFRATLEPFKSRCNAKDEGLILDRHFGAESIGSDNVMSTSILLSHGLPVSHQTGLEIFSGYAGAKPIRHRQDSEMREISTRDLKSTISFS